jgi:prepilin-type N-terminal cleavage/methylation domain-containing protein
MSLISPEKRRAAAGFTLVEILIVVGIIGIFTIVSYPSVLNVMAVRNLENTARQLQTFMHQTKLRAVSTKIPQRVRFFQVEGATWAYEMQELQPDGATWITVPGAPRKTISNRFVVTISLPTPDGDPVAVFSPVGTVPTFGVGQNEIVIRSPKLDRAGQMDERVIGVFMGGSIHYAKRASL